MYESFYKLKENPFGTTPDPRFLFRSESHRKALAYLAYGVFQKKGFLALTGEVGIGKTTVIRAFTQTFSPCLDVSYVVNTRVDFREMLYLILTDFGVTVADASKVALLGTLNRYLIEQFADNRNPVLIIDEAQNLSPDVLEELRMLSNLETNQQKLLQIVLAGQPELSSVLQREDMRQLRQRMPGVLTIEPLDTDGVTEYVRYRLAVAGLENGAVIFTEEAIRAIRSRTAGIPRLINLLCDRVLLHGYADRRRAIDSVHVDAAANELAGQMISTANGTPDSHGGTIQ